MKKRMNKSEIKKKSSLSEKNTFKGEKILIYIIALYTLCMVVVNAMKLMGCIDFRSYLMNDMFYTGALFLCLILVYESNVLGEKEKLPFMGILIGSILSICDWKFYVLLIIFVANIIVPKLLEGNGWKNILKNSIKVFFYSIMTLEVYSICMIFNEFLYTSKTQTLFLFKFLDIICVCVMIPFFLCDSDKEQKDEQNNETKSEPKKNLVSMQIIKQCIWYLLIMVILVISAIVFYKGMNNGAESSNFFMGKSIDRGYLLCEETGKEWFYFINRPGGRLGTVLQNPTSYELIELGVEISYPKLVVYIGEFLCQVLYGISGVLSVIMVSIMFFINRAVVLTSSRCNNR